MKRAILSWSGGLDSTCLLLHLLAEGYVVKTYSFKYGQKHSIELQKVKENFKLFQSKGFLVTHQVIDLTDCFDTSVSSLSSHGAEIPKGDYKDENMKSTVVENRNVIFASILYGKALSWAKLDRGPVTIFLGLHSGDHTIYPDCTEESRLACEHAFKVSNWDSDLIDYQAPFNHLDKAGVLEKGSESMWKLGLTPGESIGVLKNTHTCYSPDAEGRSCGECGSCRERLEAFEKNQLKDPIEYVR